MKIQVLITVFQLSFLLAEVRKPLLMNNVLPSGLLLCQGSVTFVCNAIHAGQDGTFSWYLSGIAFDSHVYRTDAIYPLTINSTKSGFAIQIARVTSTDGSFSFINFTLTIELEEIPNYVGQNVTCGKLLNQSLPIAIGNYRVKGPNDLTLSDVNINSVYSDVFTLAELHATWIADSDCLGNEYTYKVVLQNGLSNDTDFAKVTCLANMTCSANFMISSLYLQYKIHIIAIDSRGEAVGQLYTSKLFDGLIRNVSERPTLSVSFSRCNTYTTCQSTVNGSCIIYISLNSSNVVSETSVEGMINSSIALPDLTLNRLYYYRAVFHIGRTIQSEGNITTVQYDRKLTSGNIVFISLGIIILVIAISFLFVGFVLLRITKLEIKDTICLGVLWIMAVIVAAVDVILWIVFAGVVAPQDDTCDASWQSTRDSLLIATFLFSISAFIMATTMFIVIFIYKCKVGKFPVQHLDESPKKSGADAVLDLYGVKEDDCVIDDIGRSKAEGNVAARGHRKIGESVQEGMLRKRSEITDAVKEKLGHVQEKNSQIVLDEDGNQYDTTNFQTTSKPNPHPSTAGPSGEYSGLSRPGTKCHAKDTHYQHLHELPVEETSCQGPPIENTNSTYGQLNLPCAQNNVSGEKDVAQHKVRENRSKAHANEKSQQEKKKKEREKKAENSSTS